MKRYSVMGALASVPWAAATVIAMTYGTAYNWPDFLHVDYGFPLTFATHTLNTIAGPVDRWRMDLGALAADLVFWTGLMAAGLTILAYLERRSSRTPGAGAP